MADYRKAQEEIKRLTPELPVQIRPEVAASTETAYHRMSVLSDDSWQ